MDIDKDTIQKSIDMLKNLSIENIDKIMETKNTLDSPFKDKDLDKLIDCAHEIVFTINAHVLSQNEKGELVSSREICVKNYHIPVPIDKDYNNYMTTFFEYLEKKIIDTIQDVVI